MNDSNTTEVPYRWERDLQMSYVPGTCEWGYPEICGRDAVFVFDPSDGYPHSLFACRRHVMDLKTGVAPRVIVYKIKSEWTR